MMLSQYVPKQKKNANTLRFTPPGFKHPIDVPFPGRSLPVCERCKKNFKTREHCRSRDCHTSLPWSDTYICITLAEGCVTDDNKLVDGHFFAKAVSNQPYCLKGDIDPQTPICAPCKDKNYTRTYCRSNKKHRQLPWSTVYVVLYLVPEGSSQYPSENDPPQSGNKRRKKNPDEGDTAAADTKENADDTAGEGNTIKEKVEEEEPKVEDIPSSRTFLATVSAKRTLMEWLELDPMVQTQIGRSERGDASSRTNEDANFPSPYGMMHGPGGGHFPSGDDRRFPGDPMMGGYARFPGQEMGSFDGHMSPQMGYNRFPNASDMMQFDVSQRMPNSGRPSDMPQSSHPMPFDQRMMSMAWGQFNADMSRMPYSNGGDRSRSGMGQDTPPPPMWGMPPFMRGPPGSERYGPPGGSEPRDTEANNYNQYPPSESSPKIDNGNGGDRHSGASDL